MTTAGTKYRGAKEFLLVYKKLISAGEYRGYITYNQVAKILGISSPGNHMAREVGQILGEISEDEHNVGRPMLSALAVGVNGLPGTGFFNLARRLGKLSSTTPADELEFWREERNKIYESWRQD